MDLEELRELCLSYTYATEDVKWKKDLCFCIGGKMFCVAGLDQTPTAASFKVRDDEFDAMSSRDGFQLAPYVARYKWVMIDDIRKMSRKEWALYTRQSYELVKGKLPKKVLKNL